MPGVEIRRAESGELLVRGPTRALGYVGPASASLADSDGWYHTGDLGRIDEEGQLWITGRRIDRIVSGGATIDAVEVEEAVRSHPMVVDVCVVGVPDDEWGERVAAWVVPVEGEFDLEELDAHVRRRIAGAKVPRRWHVGHRLPRNANGKVDRIAVRARLAHAPS
jgi:O-succinylbenzoic acid--CoA ligase